MRRNRVKQQTGKDQRYIQENWRAQGNISCKDGMMRDKNSKDLTEAEEIKKRWQEYTEELYKKGLNDLDNHDSVVTHLEPDILEREISGLQEALLKAKLVEVMEFQLSYLKP